MSDAAVRPREARGAATIWAAVCLPAVLGMAVLAVDFARVRLTRSELRNAADSAALAAAAEAGSPASMRAAAIGAASQNVANGEGVRLVPGDGDIELGTWDPRLSTFTVLTGGSESNANAVRVNARLLAARNTALPLMFGAAIGRPTADVTQSSIAMARPGGFGMVGLDYITMGGNTTAAYRSDTGALNGTRGSIASNGPITLGGSSYVNGDARPGLGKAVSGGAGRVAGTTAPLTRPLNYPPADPGDAAAVNDNARLPIDKFGDLSVGQNVTLNVPGGVYYVRDFSTAAKGTVNFAGPTTVYVYRNASLYGASNAHADLPANLRIVLVKDPSQPSAGSLTIGSSAALRASVYAPLSPVTLSGTGDLYGSVVGKSIDMTGSSAVYYDTILDASGRAMLVR